MWEILGMEWPLPTHVVMNVYFEEGNTEHETFYCSRPAFDGET
jgi:hypothetical protein